MVQDAFRGYTFGAVYKVLDGQMVVKRDKLFDSYLRGSIEPLTNSFYCSRKGKTVINSLKVFNDEGFA